MYELVASTAEFIIVYKKPNVSFHSESGDAGLFATVKQQEQLTELYPVHRLDKITSGLLVMAKTAEANRLLTEQFRWRQMEKYYVAISHKKPKKKEGLIKGDMASARRGAWKLLTSQQNPAITQFFNKGMGDGKRLFIVKPYTGKTHQIRVALKSLGAPILGDELYGDSANGGRTYLHAYSLAFSLAGQEYRYTELPREGAEFLSPEFHAAFAEYQQPWLLSWPTLAKPSQQDALNNILSTTSITTDQ